MNWNDFARDVHQTAVENGLWDKPRGFDDVICECLVHLGRAYEEHRSGRPNLYYPCNAGGVCEADKTEGAMDCGSRVIDPEHPEIYCTAKSKTPHGAAVELGECVLGLLDYLATTDADIDECFSVCAQAVADEDMYGGVIKVALDSAETLLAARRINPSADFDAIRRNGLIAVVIYIRFWTESKGIDLESILRELHECEKARAGRRGDGRDG